MSRHQPLHERDLEEPPTDWRNGSIAYLRIMNSPPITIEQRDAFLKDLSLNHPSIYPIGMLMADPCLPLPVVQGFQVGDIVWSKGTISIHRGWAAHGEYPIPGPLGSMRQMGHLGPLVVQCSAEALLCLREHISLLQKSGVQVCPQTWLFQSPKTQTPWTPVNLFRRIIAPSLQQAGIPWMSPIALYDALAKLRVSELINPQIRSHKENP